MPKHVRHENATNEVTSGNEDHLRGFSTDEGDSSGEEDAFDVEKLPTIAKDDAIVKQRLERAKRQTVCLAA
jgi:nucleolar protein 15